MNNYIKIVIGHYDAALERGLNHKPTMWQSVVTTVIDVLTLNRHHISMSNGSFIIYEVIRKPLYGIIVAQVHSVYVPKDIRGTGICSMLLDAIPYDVVICDYGYEKDKIGSFYSRVKNTR